LVLKHYCKEIKVEKLTRPTESRFFAPQNQGEITENGNRISALENRSDLILGLK
jgi:hypothetical protein